MPVVAISHVGGLGISTSRIMTDRSTITTSISTPRERLQEIQSSRLDHIGIVGRDKLQEAPEDLRDPDQEWALRRDCNPVAQGQR